MSFFHSFIHSLIINVFGFIEIFILDETYQNTHKTHKMYHHHHHHHSNKTKIIISIPIQQHMYQLWLICVVEERKNHQKQKKKYQKHDDDDEKIHPIDVWFGLDGWCVNRIFFDLDG